MVEPETAEQRCLFCDCVLSHDHDSLVCSPCATSRRDYHPAHDPELRERLLVVLSCHRRRQVNVYRELGLKHCGAEAWMCIKAHIRYLRRHDHVIVGRKNGTYEYRGLRRPRRSGSPGRSRSRAS